MDITNLAVDREIVPKLKYIADRYGMNLRDYTTCVLRGIAEHEFARLTNQTAEPLDDCSIGIIANAVAQALGEEPKAYIARTLSRTVLADFALHIGTLA